MNLMMIGEEYKSIFDKLSDDYMEESSWVENILSEVNEQFEKKAINVAFYTLKLEEELLKMKEQQKQIISAMASKISIAECRLFDMRHYLISNMKSINKTSIKSPIIDILIRKNSPKTIIEDESKISQEYKITVTETKIDKNSIKKDIKEGKIVEGAYLLDSESLVIKTSIQ